MAKKRVIHQTKSTKQTSDQKSAVIHPVIRKITDLNDLNALGCRYINTANHNNCTRIITRRMRWLTAQRGPQLFMTPEQEQACERISRLTQENDCNLDRNLNMRILLDQDPCKRSKGESFNDTYIKNLLKVGVDIRFVEKENRMKLVLQDNELFISFAYESPKMVSVGYQYIADNKDDSLCRYVEKEFDRQFELAQKLTLDNNGMIIPDKGSKSEQVKHAFNLTAREWAIIILGFIASFVGGLILKAPF